ncbi:MAG: hypothetical protein COA33_008170 [Fluviicola sp.]|nr:hypothetical protein [Fluviicola sp.]
MIEQTYGEQWDFCTCVVKNDSINKVFTTRNLTDEEFDKIIVRSEQIEQRCKAFLIINKVNTPEERLIHIQRVKVCLENEE